MNSKILKCPLCSVPIFTDETESIHQCGKATVVSNGNIHAIRSNTPYLTPGIGQKVLNSIKNGTIVYKVTAILSSLFNPMSWRIFPFSKKISTQSEEIYKKALSDSQFALEWQNKYLQGISSQEQAEALEIGCGQGRNIAILNNLNYKTYGLDVYENNWWKNLPDSQFVVNALSHNYTLPYQNESFDLVLTNMVIGFFDEEAMRKIIEEVHRVLKPNGNWLLIESNPRSFARRKFSEYYLRSPWSYEAIKKLSETKFKSNGVRYEKFYAPLFPIFFNNLLFCFGDQGNHILQNYDPYEKLLPESKRGLWSTRLTKH